MSACASLRMRVHAGEGRYGIDDEISAVLGNNRPDFMQGIERAGRRIVMA